MPAIRIRYGISWYPKRRIILGLIFGILSQPAIRAESAAPFAGQKQVIDAISQATSNPGLRSEAVDLLIAIAEGRDAAGVRAVKIERAGVDLNILNGESSNNSTVRAFAIMDLVHVDTQEVDRLLDALASTPDPRDSSREVLSAACLARLERRIARTPDTTDKTALLKAALDNHDGTEVWAVRELCDLGDPGVLPAVLTGIRSIWSGDYGEQQAHLCETKVSLLSSFPSRLEALRTALSDDRYADYPLRSWAVAELGALKTKAAKATLQDFANSLKAADHVDPLTAALKQQVAGELAK